MGGAAGFLADALARQAAHRGLAERFARPAETPGTRDTCRAVLAPIIAELVERAHAEGSLRADVTADDVALLLIGLARIVEVTGKPDPEVWRRQLDLVLDGLATRPGAGATGQTTRSRARAQPR